MKNTLLGQGKKRVIDILRAKFPNLNLHYNSRFDAWTCYNGFARWVHACGCTDDCQHHSDLYYYPYGETPQLILHGFWEMTR